VAPAPFHPVTRDGYAWFLALGPLANADAHFLKGGVPFWNEIMAHGSYDGFWQARNLRPHLRAVRPAVLTVGGWFDAENLYGTLQTDRTLERQSPATERHLVMGPWDHGGWRNLPGNQLGDIKFGVNPSGFFQAEIEFPFFLHHLKGGPDPALPRAYVFETGAGRWRALEAWPPAELRPVNLYFEARSGLDGQPPDQDGFDAYPSDPARPVPYYDGDSFGMARDYMDADQRFAERRPDVLSYRTAPLEADLTLAGPIQADLWVSTTGTDADWVVKLIDELPDGVQRLVRAEVMRGKFRNSLAAPEPFVPGQPTAVTFVLNDVCHQFRPGHRLMVQVQSSWFPLVDRNPQQFLDIYQARDEDFRPARNQVYRSAALPSFLVLPVLDPGFHD
jgi:putative CocE/NonD family hydrolase